MLYDAGLFYKKLGRGYSQLSRWLIRFSDQPYYVCECIFIRYPYAIYKYQYNNGHLAKSDPIAAANNFLNALQKIPSYIEQYDSRCKALEKEIPQLQEIAGKTWKKEDELKGLKAELAALDRKLQLELAPPQQATEKDNKNEIV